MADANHTSAHACRHCGNAFAGHLSNLCTTSYQQSASDQRKRDRGVKGSGGKTRRPPNPIIVGRRVCLDCERDLPIDEFPETRSSKTGYRGVCQTCFIEFNRRRKRKALKPKRNYQMERIRTATRRGECGPPTREQYQEIVDSLPKPRQHPTEAEINKAVKRNACEAWRYHLNVMASDEWCERYYKAIGKSWSNPRLSSGDKWRVRYQQDEAFAIRQRIRAADRKMGKRQRVGEQIRRALERQKRSRSIEERLGYSLEELRIHLERQFTRGMSWARLRSGEIHIDHITPKSLFDVSNDDDYRACWCLANLRPMWAKDNLAKGIRQTHLI